LVIYQQKYSLYIFVCFYRFYGSGLIESCKYWDGGEMLGFVSLGEQSHYYYRMCYIIRNIVIFLYRFILCSMLYIIICMLPKSYIERGWLPQSTSLLIDTKHYFIIFLIWFQILFILIDLFLLSLLLNLLAIWFKLYLSMVD